MSHDPSGYVRDKYSDLTFLVDYDFTENLFANYDFDVNHLSGAIHFNLSCKAEQEPHYNLDQVMTRITIIRWNVFCLLCD